MTEPLYTVTLTRTQLMAVQNACELLARVNLGQLSTVEEHIHGLPIDDALKLREGLTELQPIVTGDPYKHASGCRNDQQRQAHEVAWGIYWGVRYPLYLERCAELGEQPNQMRTVFADPPQTCGGQPVPQVKRLEGAVTT